MKTGRVLEFSMTISMEGFAEDERQGRGRGEREKGKGRERQGKGKGSGDVILSDSARWRERWDGTYSRVGRR